LETTGLLEYWSTGILKYRVIGVKEVWSNGKSKRKNVVVEIQHT
jgi:hypothetical protein